MAATTKIEWTDASLSPWEGCSKVSPGCANCYAADRDRRWHKGAHWGPGAPRRRVLGFKKNALELNRKAARLGRKLRVFPSICDPFDCEVPAEWLADFLDVVRQTENLMWLLLTKRPNQFWQRLAEASDWCYNHCNPRAGEWLFDWVWGCSPAPKNVWIGTSAEDQKRLDERVPHLLAIPAVGRFLSLEPLLGPIDLTIKSEIIAGGYNSINPYRPIGCTAPMQPSIGWIICGGESGPKARPMHPDWARQIRDQCVAEYVPFFFKQWGEWWPFQAIESTYGLSWGERKDLCVLWPDGTGGSSLLSDGANAWQRGCRGFTKIGKLKAGRVLDGRTWDEIPEVAL